MRIVLSDEKVLLKSVMPGDTFYNPLDTQEVMVRTTAQRTEYGHQLLGVSLKAGRCMTGDSNSENVTWVVPCSGYFTVAR